VLHPEAAFLAGYAAALVGVAVGLVALGRRASDPWSSRVLAASRPPASEPPDDRPGGHASWLDADVPAFHRGVSGVALGAALLLTAVSAVRHHRPIEVIVQLALLAVISMSAHRLRSTARSSSAGSGDPPDASARPRPR
jgi:hypothetical protein